MRTGAILVAVVVVWAGAGRLPLGSSTRASAGPVGLFHGWISATESRVAVEAAPCAQDDLLVSVTLTATTGTRSRGPADLTLEPPLVEFSPRALDRGKEVSVLDIGDGMSAAWASGNGSPDADYERIYARCRSWTESSWEVGSLSATPVDRSLGDADLVTVYVLPEPLSTGLVATMLIQSHAEPVEITSVTLGPAGEVSDRHLVAAGWMEHLPAWRAQARAWGDDRGLADGADRPGTIAPLPGPTDPAPPLTFRPVDDLALRLGPYNAAVLIIGKWTFPPSTSGSRQTAAGRLLPSGSFGSERVVLTYPVLTIRPDRSGDEGGNSSTRGSLTIGLTDPIYARLP